MAIDPKTGHAYDCNFHLHACDCSDASQSWFKSELERLLTMTPSKEDLYDLAKEFEVAVNTIQRWLTGVSAPLYSVRVQVIQWLKEKKEKK